MRRRDIMDLIPEECEEIMIPILKEIIDDMERKFAEIANKLSGIQSIAMLDRVEEAHLLADEAATDFY